MEEIDQKRFEAFIKEYLDEKVLGAIRVRRMTGSLLRAAEIHEVLVVTPNRVFVVETAEVTPVSGVYGGGAHINLKANEKAILQTEIKKVELTQFLGFRIRLSLMTSEKEYRWWIQGMMPEKKSIKIEDYETILRPVFGDRLSVKG